MHVIKKFGSVMTIIHNLVLDLLLDLEVNRLVDLFELGLYSNDANEMISKSLDLNITRVPDTSVILLFGAKVD